MPDSTTTLPRPAGEPAAPGWRLLALVYDILPMIPLLMITSAVFLWLNGGRTVEKQPWLAALELLTMFALVGLYFVLSWRRGGQTVGMRPWRLVVTAGDGQAASWGALWLRYATACLTPVIGMLWSVRDPQRRALYDIAAGTVFLRLQPAAKSAT